MVAKNEMNFLINGGGSKIFTDFSEMVEALVINLGVDLVLKQGYQRIILATD